VNHLLRDLAPISDAGWDAIETEAKGRLTTHLAARRVVDFSGPHGWQRSAVDLGRVQAIAAPVDEVTAQQRRVLPFVELRAAFEVSRRELEDVERGAADLNLSGLDTSARAIALAENAAVFHGYPAAGIVGIAEAASHPPVVMTGGFERYPGIVAGAVDALRGAGIDGPYALAIGPQGYTGIIETDEHGHLLLDHLRQILGGPVVWSPGMRGAVVVSMRGGDFVLDCGEDLSIGYLDHTADAVRLYFEESIGFRVLEPDAAIVLQETASG
jgi:uncharacterized linocin/CFP29 family protein